MSEHERCSGDGVQQLLTVCISGFGAAQKNYRVGSAMKGLE